MRAIRSRLRAIRSRSRARSIAICEACAWRGPRILAACRLIRDHIPYGWERFDELNGGQWSYGVKAIAPLPRIDRWDTRLRRIVELYTLAIVDRRFWSHPRTALDLAPMVLVAMLQRGPNLGRLPGEPSPAERALETVKVELVREPLPEAAEVALEAFIDACLDGPPHRPPPEETPEETAPEWVLDEATDEATDTWWDDATSAARTRAREKAWARAREPEQHRRTMGAAE